MSATGDSERPLLPSAQVGLWWRLFGIVLLCVTGPMTVTALLNRGGPLRALWQWATFQAGDDSWFPIGGAVHYVQTHPSGAGLYQETYFESDHQFIYTPSSVLLFQLLRAIGIDFGSAVSANLISWFVLPAMAMLMWGLMLRLSPVPTGEAGWREQALRAFVAAALVFFYYPILKGYTVGQVQTWLTALLMLAILCWIGGRKLMAGMCLGLFAIVKPHIAVILLWALVRREWRFAIGFCIVAGALGLASVAAYGWEVQFEYLDLLSHLSVRGESYRGSHTVESTLYRMMQDGNNLEWDGTHTLVRYIPWVHGAATIVSLLLLATAIFSGKPRDERESLVDFGIILISIILASPVAYEHHYGILSMLILILLLDVVPDAANRPGLVMAGAAALFLSANSLAFLDWTHASIFNFLQSYRLWGALIVLAALHLLKRQRVALPTAARVAA